MEKRWYVLHSKPNKEQVVFTQLQQKGIEVFFPRIRVTPVNPRSSKVRPYFPCYLFVNVDIDMVGLNTFRWLPGARGLVSFDNSPAVVPDGLIDQLAHNIDAIDQAGDFTVRRFEPGDRVRITAGPFEGFDALFDKHLRGADRVQVLLSFLSQAPQPLQLYGGHITKIEPKRERPTRPKKGRLGKRYTTQRGAASPPHTQNDGRSDIRPG